MTEPPQLRFTFREYLRVDAESSVKHEFLDGMILAMAGGTPDHAALAATVTALLNRQLEGKRCRVYSADLRVRVLGTGFAGYPDVTVICNKLERDPGDANTATNPAVVVEILSPSTEHYDRGEKLRQYQQIASLLHVVLVAHDERRSDVWSRDGDRWNLATARSGQQATVSGVECTLDVDDVYRDPLTG
ncbi:MAG TPA: Uma2 family endonuclease [Polyangiaceae bacterium]|nr:Uma2 family endonuclease [Polyangiaceae bacterium]